MLSLFSIGHTSDVFDLLERLAHLYHPRFSNQHRPRVLHPEAFIFYVILLIGIAGVLRWPLPTNPTASQILGFSSAITPEQVVDQTNQARQAQGLPKLIDNTVLSQAAYRKGQDMMAGHYWAHVSPTGKTPWAFMTEAGYHYRLAGENLARDFSNTPDMIQAWLNSPTHRANLLNDRYTEIGVAVVPGKLEGYETTLVVQMFGTPKTEAETILREKETAVGIAAQADISPGSTQPAVLASAVLPAGELQSDSFLSPRLLTTTISFAFVIMLVATLLYDWLWAGRQRAGGIQRLVGKNWAHILYLLVIALLMAFCRDGLVS